MKYNLKTKMGFVQSWGEFGVVFTHAKSKALEFSDRGEANRIRDLLEERHLVHRFEVVRA